MAKDTFKQAEKHARRNYNTKLKKDLHKVAILKMQLPKPLIEGHH